MYSALDKSLEVNTNPIAGHIISLLTMTIPVFLYFFIFESNSKKKGSIGKQFMKLKIVNNSKNNVFIRVFFKLLPWEIAHFAMHWSMFYYSQNIETPIWVWVTSFVPYLFVFVYLISLIISKGRITIYDKIAGTEVKKINS
jgi:uncharacterized RDD family membrane protein YckC